MKIRNGNWLIQEHLDIMNPVYFFRADPIEDGLRVYVAPKNIEERQFQLDVPLFTYTFHAAQEDTLGVRIEHFAGVRDHGPVFAVEDAHPSLGIQEDADTITLQSGKLTAVLHKQGPWQIEYFFAGRKLTRSGSKGAGYARDKRTDAPYVFE